MFSRFPSYLSNGGSQGGYIIFISDLVGNRSPISWLSWKIKRVGKSTLPAETLALLDVAEAGILVGKLLKQSLGVAPIIKYYVDNRSLVDSAYSTTNIEDKMLRISMAVLRDMILQKTIHQILWVKSANQIANPLTRKEHQI